MTTPVMALNDQRTARDRARADFKRRLGLAQVDLAPAVLKRRAMGEVQRKALSVSHQAIDIASDNRGVVAATIAAILLWLVRKPLGTGTTRLISRFRTRKSMARKLGDKARQVTGNYWQRLKDYADD